MKTPAFFLEHIQEQTMTSLAQVIAALQDSDAVLRPLGVRSLSVFGSVARGEAGLESDVDVLYEFDPGAATLDHLLDLERVLTRLLGRDVDLVSRKHAGPILRRYIGEETVTVYDATTLDTAART